MENYHVNAVAPLMITKQMLQLLKTAENGHKTVVVNISSTLEKILLNFNIIPLDLTSIVRKHLEISKDLQR